jgi:tetratricopeptide (TPR) repeat protein
MALFGDLFGKKKPEPKPAAQPAPAPAAATPVAPAPVTDSSGEADMIRAYDSFGREVRVKRQDWYNNVLVAAVQKEWNDAERLFSLIVQALQDKFFPEMVEPAERLREIDPNKERSATLLAVVYLNVKRLADAERVLNEHVQAEGESGIVLANLAKVYFGQGDEKRALDTIWRALEMDPNQSNGLGWYESLHREKEGTEAGLDALRRVAALPASWRAQTWLARAALQAGQLEKALEYYDESLARAGTPVPGELLMQMSADLGGHGHLQELLRLTEPRFDIALHGLNVGNNLIKANLDTGRIDAARALVDALYAQKRPDWARMLSYWDTEIAKRQVASTPVEQGRPLKMTMLRIEGPVWLDPASPADELFPAKEADSVSVCFLGSSAEVPNPAPGAQRQITDGPGRVSRALPLFFAEQVYFGSESKTQTLIPWIAEAAPGFVLCCRWGPDEEAARHARAEDVKADYAVIIHLDAKKEPWKVDLRVVRTIDAKCLGVLEASFPSTQPDTAIPGLGLKLLALLKKEAEVQTQAAPAVYQVPKVSNFAYYLVRLEQLLAVRCATMEGVPKTFLSGERDIIEGNIQTCLADPKSLPARLVLLKTLASMKKVRPEIIPEFREKLMLLQKEKPLAEPGQAVAQRLLDEVLGQV